MSPDDADVAHERARRHMVDAFVGLLFSTQHGVVPPVAEVKRFHDEFFHDGNGPLKQAYAARTSLDAQQAGHPSGSDCAGGPGGHTGG